MITEETIFGYEEEMSYEEIKELAKKMDGLSCRDWELLQAEVDKKYQVQRTVDRLSDRVASLGRDLFDVQNSIAKFEKYFLSIKIAAITYVVLTIIANVITAIGG